jgi:hypothetical protein
MDLKEKLSTILVNKLKKFLVYTHSDIKDHLEKCSTITELIYLPDIASNYYAQIELNPLYEREENGTIEIVCVYFISDGENILSSTICFPKDEPAYYIDMIYNASGPTAEAEYRSISSETL